VHVHVQRLVSVVKMATVFEVRNTEGQSSVVRFSWGGGTKNSMKRIFIKKCLLLTVRRICRAKRFRLRGKRFADDEKVEMEVWK
jgi:hypothetical protein